MNRSEHLGWAKKRAIQEVKRGSIARGFASLQSDFSKHPELANHSAIELGTMLAIGGHLDTAEKMIKHIEGYN